MASNRNPLCIGIPLLERVHQSYDQLRRAKKTFNAALLLRKGAHNDDARHRVDDNLTTAFGADNGDVVSITDGFSAGLLGAAGIAALGAIAAAVWLRTPAPDATAQQEHEAVSA